jgi:hypothetical protein
VIATSYFVAAIVAAALACATLGFFVDRLARRRANRAIDGLAAAASEAARREVAAPLLARLERAIGKAEALGGELARLGEERAVLAADVARREPSADPPPRP